MHILIIVFFLKEQKDKQKDKHIRRSEEKSAASAEECFAMNSYTDYITIFVIITLSWL